MTGWDMTGWDMIGPGSDLPGLRGPDVPHERGTLGAVDPAVVTL
jgi:hypothetical protein